VVSMRPMSMWAMPRVWSASGKRRAGNPRAVPGGRPGYCHCNVIVVGIRISVDVGRRHQGHELVLELICNRVTRKSRSVSGWTVVRM